MEEKKKVKEIDILGLLLKAFAEKKSLLAFIVGFTMLGIVVALNVPKVYTAQVILAPEMSAGGLGMSSNLSEIASNFGIEFGSKSSADAIYPEVYPDIFASNEFVKNLFDVKVRTYKDNKTKSFYQHIKNDIGIPFWSYPKVWLVNMLKDKSSYSSQIPNDPFKMSRSDYELCEAIKGNINCLVDKKTSIITINMSDQDPLVAAIMVDTLQHRLQEYITDYKTKKARTDYNYYKKLNTESKAAYIKAQEIYASYSDANEDVILQSFQSKRDELENEMQLKYNIYTQTSAQMQMAKAKIQANTPAFTIIEKATMPYKATSMPKTTIVMLFIALGFIFDVVWVNFVKPKFKSRK